MYCRIVTLVGLVYLSFTGAVCARGADALPAPGGKAAISPENTKIQFVCAHVGPKPDPRKGTFQKFSGQAVVEGNTLKSISFAIDTTSLVTDFDKLTTHLKSPDFFETRRYPTATFESTKITAASQLQQISGKLTLHGVTKEITIPAQVQVTPAGLRLSSEFVINRLDYGINYDPKKVEAKVSLTVTVGDES